MANYETTLELNDAFILDAPFLEDVFRLANAFLETPVSIALEFAKVHELNSNSLADVLSDSLLRTNTITKIEIQGSHYRADPSRRFIFIATGETFSPTCRLRLQGNQNSCRALTSNIEALLRAKRQWYSSMVLKESFLGIWGMAGLAILVLAIPVAIFWLIRPSLAGPIAAGELAGAFALLVLLNRLREFLFPKLIVDIGHSAKIGSRARGARRFLFGTVLMTLTIGIAGSLIANYLSKPH